MYSIYSALSNDKWNMEYRLIYGTVYVGTYNLYGQTLNRHCTPT